MKDIDSILQKNEEFLMLEKNTLKKYQHLKNLKLKGAEVILEVK